MCFRSATEISGSFLSSSSNVLTCASSLAHRRQQLGVTQLDLAIAQGVTHLLGGVHQAQALVQRVRGPAEEAGRFAAIPVAVAQGLRGSFGLLERGHVAPDDVLGHRGCAGLLVRQVFHVDVDLGVLAVDDGVGAHAPFAGHDLRIGRVVRGGAQQRLLQQALGLHRLDQLAHGGGIELIAGVVAAHDRAQRHSGARGPA